MNLRITEIWAWFWPRFKDAFGFAVALWAVFLLSFITLRIVTPEAIASATPAYWATVGAIITGVLLPIHWWYKNRQKNK